MNRYGLAVYTEWIGELGLMLLSTIHVTALTGKKRAA